MGTIEFYNSPSERITPWGQEQNLEEAQPAGHQLIEPTQIRQLPQAGPLIEVGEKKAPIGVKILSILYFVGAFASLVLAILLIIAGALGGTTLFRAAGNIPGYDLIAGFLTVFAIVAGVIILVLGVLEFFIGRGLWKGRNWARIVAIIFSVLGILGSINSFLTEQYTSGGAILAVNLLIFTYLIFSRKVKGFFKKI